MCRQYAPAVPDACNEEDAPEVRNKTTANFCDYFDPDPNVFDGSESQADAAARAKLNDLFGAGHEEKPVEREEKSSAEKLMDQAEDLFKN